MTDELSKSKKVKEAQEFLKLWMSLTPMEKAQASGYLDCLRSVRPCQDQKTA